MWCNIMVVNSLSVKVSSAYPRDVGLGRIRISLKNMKKLGISKGAVVEINGKKNQSQNAFHFLPLRKTNQARELTV